MERLETDKYHRWYWAIVDRRKDNKPEGYSEKHHIIPKCFGGVDDTTNLVRLTAREHFICHLLLTKMFKDDGVKTSKMVVAWCWMAWGGNINKYQQRGYRVNSRIFESLRNAHAICMSESQTLNNSQAGTMWLYNETTRKCVKSPLSTEIPNGWCRGRVLNWDAHFQRKIKDELRPSVCANCSNELTKYNRRFCSKECSNSHKYHKEPQMITISRDGVEKTTKSVNMSAYKRCGWVRVD